MAEIILKDIMKRYDGNVVAVHNFNLKIEDEEFVILVGPSGCGKSTTLRMIAGLEDITEGELFIGDRLVNDVAPKDRDIAMVFQSYALYPHMTVYENMAFALEMRKMPKAEIKEKVTEAAKILDIEEYLDRKPKQLSGGQRQRVALGRAIVRNPSVFLLDEPLSNLDAKLRTQMRTEITKLHKKLKTTFVYVTHDQTEAMTMGDRIVVMKDGYIQQVDTPMNLYNKPCNKFVAQFIGSPQMNIIEARITNNEDKFFISFNGISIEIPSFKGGREVFGKYINKEVLVGIRPEDISLGSTSKNAINVKVDLAELMGSEMYVYSTFNEHKLTAKVQSTSAIKTDDLISLSFDAEKLHIFDIDTEATICN